jgi:hypothetical protein
MTNAIILPESDEDSKHEPLETIRAEKYATFLNNLEKWVEATVRQDDIDDEEVIRRVKESYSRSLQANIEYYDTLAKRMEQLDEKQSAKQYTQMAKVYRALIE